MECLECGAENSENTKFCEVCGKKLSEGQKIYEDILIPSIFLSKLTSSKGLGKKLLIGVLIVIILAIIGYYAFSQLSVPPQSGTVFVNNTVSGTVDIVVGGNTYNYPVKTYLGYGSGFIITEDGYVITAAHVIADPAASEEGKITPLTDDKIKFYLCRIAAREYLNRTQSGTLTNITNEQLNQITRNGMANGTLQPKTFEQKIYVTGPGVPDSVANPRVARIVDMSNPDSEVDIGLLKIDNVKERLPALRMNSAQIRAGDTIRICGYPNEQIEFYKGLSDGQNKEVLNKMYTATLTQGIVSAERLSPKGTQYYQTDAATDSGNSGGPVLNGRNQVIGILVKGFPKQGFNFFIPSKYAIEICKKNGVNLGWNFFPFNNYYRS